ncbi:hypothetical protein FE257_006594 [Aspergillus nanangensis]|uniref:Pyridoxamine 5'-phosphate oxidase Alr4036 family FMN-binding domain-containing protein n=1 Tax=Aspergillus nanangensis TaxID=2582783 RepID=A0AAD4GYA3_ASPNN|nr:hypothetical protein FE257_006594 [Aspergillus nanangensis]
MPPQSQSQPPPPAPWRPLFQNNLTSSPSTFTLTTIDRDAANRPIPRARICEFRGFWPSPPLHPNAVDALNQQYGGPNPAIYESDMLSLTTDARMPKVAQIGASGHVVEGLFWLKDVMSSFKNPPPGQPRSIIPEDANLRVGQTVEDLHDPVARGNFRVVVIRPVAVERLDLSDLQNMRRQQWSLVEGENRWEEVELWP